MPDPTTKPEGTKPEGEGNDTPDDLDARLARIVDTRLNGAITGHLSRFEKKFQATLAESLAKLQPPAAPAGEKPVDAAPGAAPAKADPEALKLREQVEKLTRKYEESETARRASEDKARKDATRQQVREALELRGIKGPRLRAVLNDLEATGSLRYLEDGTPQLVVKRARAKGASAQELAFDDLAEGVGDWIQTDDAKEFLPAPGASAAPANGARRPTLTSGLAQGGAQTEAKDLNEAARMTAARLQAEGKLPAL